MSKFLAAASSLALVLASSTLAFGQSARRNAAADPDLQELAAYTLTMDGLNKVDRVNKDIIAAIQKNPGLAPKDDDSAGDAKTLSDMEKKINAVPVMASALKQEGLSARDYAKFTMAMMQASFALVGKQMSAKTGKPFQLPAEINPANVTFVEQHQADLKKLEQSYQQVNGGK